MKLAMVMLTRNDGSGVTVNGRNMESPMFLTITPRGVWLCVLVLLACLGGLAVASWWYARVPAKVAVPGEYLLAAQATNPRLLVESWNRSEPLKRGQRVVLASVAGSGVRVGQVAGTPNEAVVLRRGGTVDTLLLLGAGKYYVVSENGAGRVVNSEEIRGVCRESAAGRSAM